MLTTLTAYLYAAMLSWVPLSAHTFRETEPVTTARYLDFAEHLANVALDPNEVPLYDSPSGRAKTALLLASIASFETGQFDPDVIWCLHSGDGGRAWGPWQTHASKERACLSIESAAHQALEQIRESRRMCASLPVEWRLSGFTAGNCRDGHAESARRVNRAMRYWEGHAYEL